MTAKTCKQCGVTKPIEQYRKYYGGRKGSYTICLDCEKINSRYKYLSVKGECMGWGEEAEFDKISKLYDMQRSIGLQPPRYGNKGSGSTESAVDNLIAGYQDYADKCAELTKPKGIQVAPMEIINWMATPLTFEPEYYLDTVYEDLKTKYRPVKSIDDITKLPKYDDTNILALDALLERFNIYEDSYYAEDSK